MPAPLEFWFEFASTYSYPAAMRVEALCAAAGVPLRWRPFLLGPIFAAQGWNDSPFNIYPVKGRNMWRDMERLCAAAGVPLRRPSAFPRGSLVAARVACAAAAEPWIGRFVRAVYTANFAADRAIGEAPVIGEILEAIGQSAATWLARAQADDVKQALRAQTDAAIARGIFGAPSCTVGDELFWGNDRLEAAIDAAVGPPDTAPIEEVLAFWFGPADEAAAPRRARVVRWFTADPDFDAEVRRRFGGLVCAATHRQLDHWAGSARGRLALVVLLDQFTRNVYRDRVDAYAADPYALRLVLTGIDAGLDCQLDFFARSVFYLPLEHSEDPAIQARSVGAYTALAADAPPELRDAAEQFLAHARGHQQTIARFGRFPARNAVLGRTSTAEELKAMSDER
ncbi:MAG: DUF924 family protein [Deltaproteobacteria bacterium]|nr:DUF924 family protein [Deltaproteobacteria bacterium]